VIQLTSPLELRGRVSPSRILFGPHVTNLGRRNCFTDRHAAYYAARAKGGAGIVVLEQACVHSSDQPYELAPHTWADGFEKSLTLVGRAVQANGALVIASLGHSGGQATGALSQRAVLAPSPFQEVATREVAKAAEIEEIEEIVDGFRSAAAMAVRAGLDGVEVNAGQHSLVRQFLSGLTNSRSDGYGGDDEGRARFAREVVAAVREGLGGDRILGLRLCVDEFAPWAGITPDMGVALARALTAGGDVDYLLVTRGGPYSLNRTQPGGFIAEPRDEALIARVRAAISSATAVFAQGGIADIEVAAALVDGGTADGVEMTRALIADENLPAHLRAGRPDLIRPCLLCNQDCQVRGGANNIVSCIHNPAAGHEAEAEFSGSVPVGRRRRVLVVGAGPAGLEAARVAASLGHAVEVWDAGSEPGGAVRLIAGAPTRERYLAAVKWRVARLRALGVEIHTNRVATLDDLLASDADRIILATGARPRDPSFGGVRIEGGRPPVFTHRDVLAAVWAPSLQAALDGGGPVVVFDLVDDFSGPSAAEVLAARLPGIQVLLVTPEHFVGAAYLPQGGLPDLRLRLHAARVQMLPEHSFVRGGDSTLVFRRHYRAEETRIEDVAALVVCDREEPDDHLFHAAMAAGLPAECIGDALAPRRIIDAVLEGGRAARQLGLVRATTKPVSGPLAGVGEAVTSPEKTR